jgi:hypothetical protein
MLSVHVGVLTVILGTPLRLKGRRHAATESRNSVTIANARRLIVNESPAAGVAACEHFRAEPSGWSTPCETAEMLPSPASSLLGVAKKGVDVAGTCLRSGAYDLSLHH